jgi:hypothetical protein
LSKRGSSVETRLALLAELPWRLHAAGINCRHLGVVRRHSRNADARALLLTEGIVAVVVVVVVAAAVAVVVVVVVVVVVYTNDVTIVAVARATKNSVRALLRREGKRGGVPSLASFDGIALNFFNAFLGVFSTLFFCVAFNANYL